ncbi:MAG: DNA polymerase/3'-5' exonuclease PolX [Candidatus Magasanikbacteria bacterium]
MKNKEVATILHEIADLLEMKDVEWKPRAYRKAAREIGGLSEDITDVYEQGEIEEIEGIGEGIAEKIREYLDEGEIEYHQELKEDLPVDIEAMTAVEGLGPKSIKKLYQELGITELEELKQAAQDEKIEEVEGFGKKSQQKILDHIEMAIMNKQRMLLGEAWPIAQELKQQLRQSDNFNRIDIAGSYRRRKPTIGDLDILATSNNPDQAMEEFCNLKDTKEVLAQGETKSSIVVSGNLQIDLRLIDSDSYGSALNYFTGSKDHGITLRSLAKDQDKKLSEYGVFKEDTEEKLAGETEKRVYEELGLQFIEPELREDTGEVKAAKQNELPNLIEPDQIKGDMQMHTNYSDGDNSIEEMAKKAQELGYEYITITDHGPTVSVAGGMEIEGFKEQEKEIDKVNEKLDIEILHGAELDIVEGGLDLDKEDCKFFDVTLAAMHNETSNPTEDLVKAFSEWPIDIWAHPLNRKVNKRKPIEFDPDRAIEAAADNDIVVEINANPERLDLPWRLVKKYKDKVNFVISTDAHSTSNLEYMKFGVFQARRGWLEKSDVINTKPLSKLF